MNVRDAVLNQADRVDPAPYKPVGSFVMPTDACVLAGYMRRSQVGGGFYLTEAGKRRLAVLRQAQPQRARK